MSDEFLLFPFYLSLILNPRSSEIVSITQNEPLLFA